MTAAGSAFEKLQKLRAASAALKSLLQSVRQLRVVLRYQGSHFRADEKNAELAGQAAHLASQAEACAELAKFWSQSIRRILGAAAGEADEETTDRQPLAAPAPAAVELAPVAKGPSASSSRAAAAPAAAKALHVASRSLSYVPLFGALFAVLAEATEAATAAAANRDNCVLLARRCAQLKPTLQQARDRLGQAAPTEAHVASLRAVQEALEGARDLIAEFSDAGRLRRLFSAERFQSRFLECDQALTRCVADFAVLVAVGLDAGLQAPSRYVAVSLESMRHELARELAENQRQGQEWRELAAENEARVAELEQRLAQQRLYAARIARELGLELDDSGRTIVRRPPARRPLSELELSAESERALMAFCVPERELGSGGFADVYRGEYLGVPVAIKRLRAAAAIELQTPEQLAADFRKEVGALASVDSPFVVRVLGFSSRPPNLLMVTELAAGGNLRTALAADEAQTCSQRMLLTSEQLLRIARQLAAALAHLHSQRPPLVHRDVKPANVLLTETLEAKLCDFGLARVVDPATNVAQATLPGAGSPPYMAPEVVLREGQYLSEKADVFSFGATLVHMFTGRAPDEGSTFAQIERKTRLAGTAGRQVLDRESSDLVPPAIAQLIRDCTAYAPLKRPPMADVLRRLEALEREGAW